jgi:hypothetical protein
MAFMGCGAQASLFAAVAELAEAGGGEGKLPAWSPAARAAVGAAVLEHLRTLTAGTVARRAAPAPAGCQTACLKQTLQSAIKSPTASISRLWYEGLLQVGAS